jgi:hypothetical protein
MCVLSYFDIGRVGTLPSSVFLLATKSSCHLLFVASEKNNAALSYMAFYNQCWHGPLAII